MLLPKAQPIERRKFLRLDSVFPVEFMILGADTKTALSAWGQGFTRDIGRGGICLIINHLEPGLVDFIKNPGSKLSLKIEMPVFRAPVSALAKIAWVQEIDASKGTYSLGLSYEEINPALNSKIMCYAWMKKLFIPVSLALIILLSCGFIIAGYINTQLVEGNRRMVQRLVEAIQESTAARNKLSQLTQERQALEAQIQKMNSHLMVLDREKSALGKESKLKEKKLSDRMKSLNLEIEKLISDKKELQNKAASLEAKQATAAKDIEEIDKKREELAKANMLKMYRWLKVHQNSRSGLVMSFEGDGDIANWAFIYDQALVAQAYTLFSDSNRAKVIFNFFAKKAQKGELGLFYNAYYVNDGSVAEYTIHSGPNIWLGIAIAQYTRKTGDYSYFALAERIAQAIINLQNQDSEAGIRGGPKMGWYSTEHNLDAFAFFDMLYSITGKEQYSAARDKVLLWLVSHTYDKMDVPIMRGKGDSTIATDTYAWSIAALGPSRLEALGMNPNKILEFAETNCAIEVDYARPEGRIIKVRGFDFAPARHVARGGVISCEWTAQMVMSFKIMADYYHNKNMPDKAREYQTKANTCLASLGNLVISSPSASGQGEGCLPYATQENVDTGHGWMTPKGKTTGSVAGTAYALFAYYGYNPLKLNE